MVEDKLTILLRNRNT